ncbi:MAG: hypothetical protein ACRD68_10195, partial [Pyrinomonadaceae bacterium]
WRQRVAELSEELGALRRLMEKQRAVTEAQPKKWTQADRDAGRDQAARRHFARLDSWTADERKYTEYLRTLNNLLALRRDGFDPSGLRVEDLIAKSAMGEPNTTHDLQNYVVGPAPSGLALNPDGSLDTIKSFVRVDYFALLDGLTVRNNVQPGVASRPVDFVATRIPREALGDALAGEDATADEIIWLHGGRDTQALILGRGDGRGRLHLRYLPVRRLAQDAAGRVRFERAEWRAGLPLKIWEDAELRVPEGESRAGWLDGWHGDLEWLRAAHRTKYSNAVVGLHEQLARHTTAAIDPDEPDLSEDERLIRRFRRRQRLLVETDLLILANDHWNFDVRGFNPGGNHGSFFRVSAHSTLMVAGGDRTGVARGLLVEEPYDSLSFMPTLLRLTGQLEDERKPVPVLWQEGFRPFPGRVIEEIFLPSKETTPPVARTSSDATGNDR